MKYNFAFLQKKIFCLFAFFLGGGEGRGERSWFEVSVCFPCFSATSKTLLYRMGLEVERQPWSDPSTVYTLQLEHTESNICTSRKCIE